MAKIVIRFDLNDLMTRSRYCFGARWSSGPSGAEENGSFNTSVDNLPFLAPCRLKVGDYPRSLDRRPKIHARRYLSPGRRV